MAVCWWDHFKIELFFIEVAVPRKSLMALIDDPSNPSPPLNASSIFSFIWLAFLLISSPFSVFPNTISITLAISSCLVSESTPLATSTQTPTSFSSIWELKHCSPPSGQPMIGIPWLKLSSTEFQPQWLRNAPMDLWDKISCWGAGGPFMY